MKLLLTSAGIKNASIRDALLDLLGKPIAECDALCIPTATYGHPLIWVPWVEAADVQLVNGGDALYLCHRMRESGLTGLLPSLDAVWVGLTAGSTVMTPSVGEDFVIWQQPGGGDEALGVVDFAIFPHVDNPDLPENTMATAERWAAGLTVPAYEIDDETAIRVVDGTADVVSEGRWKLFTR